jgi:hypothetical protein
LKSYSEKNAQLEREVAKLQTQLEEKLANAKISEEGESRSSQKQFGHQLVQHSVVLSSMPIRNFN